MNERIKELAERAGMLFDERGRPLWVAMDQVDKTVFLKDFTELIVKQSAAFISILDAEPMSHKSAAKLLLKHFGVEP